MWSPSLTGQLMVLTMSCLFLCGCAKKHEARWGIANGKVLCGSEPLTMGSVVFKNKELGVARGAELLPDGTFVMRSADYPGLPVGKYLVAIVPNRIHSGEWVPAMPSDRRTVQHDISSVPSRFRTAETSGLTAEVNEGQNRPFIFELAP
jgi:hypothetical protein